MLDVNADGIPELFINAMGTYEEWLNTLVFTYDTIESKVVFVDDICSYTYISYSGRNNAISYADVKPSATYASYVFCELKDNNLEFRFSVGYDTDENGGSYCFYYDGEDISKVSEENEGNYFDDWIYVEYKELPRDASTDETVEEMGDMIDLSYYLNDDNLSRVVSIIDGMQILDMAGYKEYAAGDNLAIGILSDKEAEYNQITDIINTGNINISLYGICVGDSFEKKVKQSLSDNYPGLTIEETGNGEYAFWLGDAAVLNASFSNEKLTSYVYKLRYTSF